MPDLSSAASAANFSTESDAVGAGQFVPESVVSLLWNPWSVSRGIGGQFPPESVVRLDRNTHRFCLVISFLPGFSVQSEKNNRQKRTCLIEVCVEKASSFKLRMRAVMFFNEKKDLFSIEK
jgi:hypothetical protein